MAAGRSDFGRDSANGRNLGSVESEAGRHDLTASLGRPFQYRDGGVKGMPVLVDVSWICEDLEERWLE